MVRVLSKKTSQKRVHVEPHDGGLGVTNGQLGFNITGTSNIVIVVEASSDPSTSVWTPAQTLTLTNGLSHFSEPILANRFYRLHWP